MKLYISGPMTGLPGLNYRTFNEAEKFLRERGYETSNPAQYPDTGDTWENYLKRDLKDLLNCHGVALLPGWQDSKGAMLEHYVGTALAMPAYELSLWLNTDPTEWDERYVR